MAMDKEREALVERLKWYAVESCGGQLEADINAAIAALTAQQEPVAELQGAQLVWFNGGVLQCPPGTKFYTAPPSGVREGMLRAAEIAYNIEDDRVAPSSAVVVAEAITRAAEPVNADDGYADAHPKPFYDPSAGPTPQPADGVVVPRHVLDSLPPLPKGE